MMRFQRAQGDQTAPLRTSPLRTFKYQFRRKGYLDDAVSAGTRRSNGTPAYQPPFFFRTFKYQTWESSQTCPRGSELQPTVTDSVKVNNTNYCVVRYTWPEAPDENNVCDPFLGRSTASDVWIGNFKIGITPY